VFLIYEQKSGNEEAVPMAPQFAAWLRKRECQEGPVFHFRVRTAFFVGRAVTSFGKEAGVEVSRDGKHATAHDIRRSFATRWAAKLMPVELKAVMRHKNIATTLEYYVEMEPTDVVRKMHAALG
jgi:integrase